MDVKPKTVLTCYYSICPGYGVQAKYFRASWPIPEDGTEVWCTAWKRGQTIKPYGDGRRVVVGLGVFYCDEFVKILYKLEKDGHLWGIDRVAPTCEQKINNEWVPVDKI